jgi:hypothetical protein
MAKQNKFSWEGHFHFTLNDTEKKEVQLIEKSTIYNLIKYKYFSVIYYSWTYNKIYLKYTIILEQTLKYLFISSS